ncbi:MAG: aminoacyl-tRNA hydrolase [Christensenellaceae bacterium]|jgi:PTH1 family peptidyl-tRNA hydrolase|nr:aminoacyl-tRNA hydrolase [Christensenellaceae bacterium]
MLLIVGLGNPGREYEKTLHNMGFLALSVLAEKYGKKFVSFECDSLTTLFQINGGKIILAKPQTYMNLSGKAVKGLLKKYDASLSDLIVIYDDFDIPKLSVRARERGSAGTHNGMKSIIAEVNSDNFKRIRVGIGSTNIDKKDFVLSSLSNADLEAYNNVFNEIADTLIAYTSDNDFNNLMRTLNK